MTTAVQEKPSATAKALEILHQGVIKLMSSEGWQEALRFRARFHQYSFFNTSLILAQKPDATLVAGYKRWLELKRFVKKGEKGIAILAPLLRKASDKLDKPEGEGTPRILVGFRVVYVFDVSQTDGEPLPVIDNPTLLEGDSEAIQQTLAHLEAFAISEGLTVKHDFNHTSALGVYRPAAKLIALRPDLSPLQRLKTFIHELAHAQLHDTTENRSVAELEAESCAFLVCQQLGLDTSQHSFAYLAHWADSLEALIASGERASKAAEQILSTLQCTHSG